MCCASAASRSRAGAALLALLFIFNITYISPGRTALVVIPVLILIFGLRRFGWKGLSALSSRARC